MATITNVIYTCDNCDKTLAPDDDTVQHFTIIYADVRNAVDLCEECAERVAWLHAKGTRVEAKVGRPRKSVDPSAPRKPRGRPRKVPPVGTGTDTGPLPEPVVATVEGRVTTLGELFGEAGDTVASTDLSDDGMGGAPLPTLTSVPTHPAFAAPPSP